MSTRPTTQKILIGGPAGAIETLIEVPATVRGIALVCHPHPLFGGTHTNKVVHTLARTLRDLGYISFRPNFRGVGQSSGTHDQGQGERDDMLAVIDWARTNYPHEELVLAGFSFGAYVQTQVAKHLQEAGTPAKRMILVGTAAGHVEGARHYETEAVERDTIVIHGAKDETVPLENVLAWAEPLDHPLIVIPGADHFFHGKLHLIKDIIMQAWHAGSR